MRAASRVANVAVQTMWYCGIAQRASSLVRSSGCSKHFQGCPVSRSAIHATSSGSVTPKNSPASGAGRSTSSIPSMIAPAGRAASMTGPATSLRDWPFTGLAASRYTRRPTLSDARSATPVITIPP